MTLTTSFMAIDGWEAFIITCAFTILIVSNTFIYRLWFHPLSQIPGPKAAALSGLYEIWYDIIRHGKYVNVIEQMPADYYLKSTQDHLLGSIPGQEECDLCMDDDAQMLCSQCKAVRYCSKECQAKAWKEGHKRNCWKMLDEMGKDF